jgi:aryl-alcohol dehydrogenase-like predicted oxidoreductase
MSHSATLSAASTAGTSRYTQRFPTLPSGHFRERYGLWLSSIGLGTYLGNADDDTDEQYVASIQTAARHGCNVIDTAVNYRFMRSERAVGRALQGLFASGEFQRDEIVVCTKGGYIPYEDVLPEDRMNDLQQRFYATGLAQPSDIAGHIHCMTPDYLSHQIDTSLNNLGLASIDVYYLHNPETQLDYVAPEEFMRRMRAAFTRLEAEADAGRIRFYGIATWQGLRVEDRERNFLPLSLLVKLAQEVGGDPHRFRFLQFPYSTSMLEAFTSSNQPFERVGTQGQPERVRLQLLAAAVQYGMVAVTSASLLQTQVIGHIPPHVRNRLGSFDSDAQAAIHFNRSTPGVTTALVGMRRVEHVLENLAVANTAPMPQSDFFGLFQRS